MRVHLKRYYGHGHLHFITFRCYRRAPLLQSPTNRSLTLTILEEVRKKYEFVVLGYVIMPEHVHLLINEPAKGDPSLAMQVFKQRTSRAIPHQGPQFWQLRFYDFNVFTERKRVEKLHYMHWNPVERKLVSDPAEWEWSSYHYYASGIQGRVLIDQGWKSIKVVVPDLEHAK